MASAIKPPKRILPAFLLAVLVASCNNYEITQKQADSFIKFFGSYQQDDGVDVRVDDDGGYVIAGTWTDPDSARQICLIKTDELGNEVDWSPKLYGFRFDDVARDLQVLDDGYLIVGTTYDADDSLDILLIRTDRQGNLKSGFPRVIDFGGNDEVTAVDASLDSVYTFAGYTDALGNKDFLIFQTDPDGTQIGASNINSLNANDELTDITRYSDGFVVVGNTNSYPPGNYVNFISVTNLFGKPVSGNTTFGNNNRNELDQHVGLIDNSEVIVSSTSTNLAGTSSQISLTRVSIDLTQVVTIGVTSPETGNFTGQSVSVTGDGNYILVGTVTQNDANIYALGLGTDGSQMFYTTFGRTGEQSAGRFRITPDGGLVIVGSNGFESNSMVTLIKTGPEGSMDN